MIVGLGGIAYPICIEKMMRMYGFRGKCENCSRFNTMFVLCDLRGGTALMTGAMSLNSIVGMTMMHPVEWHARKPEDVRAEKRRAKEEWKLRGVIPASDRRYSDFTTAPVKTRCSSLTSLKDESGKQVPLLIETLKVSFVVSRTNIRCSRERCVHARGKQQRVYDKSSSRAAVNYRSSNFGRQMSLFYGGGGGEKKEKNMSSFRIFPNRIFNFSSSSGRVDECVDEDTLDNKVFENKRSLKDITRLGTRRKIENGKFKSTERYP